MTKLKTGLLALAAAGTLGIQSQALAVTNFEAELTGPQVAPPLGPTTETKTGGALLELNDAETELKYKLDLSQFDLDGLQTPGDALDDVTAIHIHMAAVGVNGPHVLNIFGMPRQDDLDMTYDPATGMVMGIWDDLDENFTGPGNTKTPGDSQSLSSSLSLLKDGDLYFQIHTGEFPNGAIRGQINTVVPEPATASLAALTMASLLGYTRRKR